jgi:hypothetical protein
VAEPISFEINGHAYKARRMNAFQQWNVARKVSPIVAKTMTPDTLRQAVALMPKGDGANGDLDGFLGLVGSIVPPALQALADMSDKDSMEIITACLATVQVQRDGIWANVYSAGGLMFDDIDMLEMMAIVVRVVMGNLAGFSFASLSNLIPGTQPQAA